MNFQPAMLKARREAIRWHLLSAIDISRPVGIYTEALLSIVQSVYPDATHQEIRRNLGAAQGGRALHRVSGWYSAGQPPWPDERDRVF